MMLEGRGVARGGGRGVGGGGLGLGGVDGWRWAKRKKGR